jgi:hypothetical protein
MFKRRLRSVSITTSPLQSEPLEFLSREFLVGELTVPPQYASSRLQRHGLPRTLRSIEVGRRAALPEVIRMGDSSAGYDERGALGGRSAINASAHPNYHAMLALQPDTNRPRIDPSTTPNENLVLLTREAQLSFDADRDRRRHMSTTGATTDQSGPVFPDNDADDNRGARDNVENPSKGAGKRTRSRSQENPAQRPRNRTVTVEQQRTQSRSLAPSSPRMSNSDRMNTSPHLITTQHGHPHAEKVSTFTQRCTRSSKTTTLKMNPRSL